MPLRYLSFLDLRSYRPILLRRDFLASLTVTFLDIPQGVAYALIAGLPPVMGLYAAAVPAIVGALFRSSRHVVTGPTNALSLLVGSAVAAATAREGATPMEVGITLAFMVGALQFLAGLLRLDAIADYISYPVVRGYITGAAILIAVGQLPNVTGSGGSSGNLAHMVMAWGGGLPHTNPLAVLFALGTLVIVVGLRRVDRRIPGSIIVMVISIGIGSVFRAYGHQLQLVADLAPIPAGLPPLTIPALGRWTALVPAAAACAVLSLVESSSVARALASRTGQRLDMAAEFAGQGLANIAAAFSGGYPVSGSLARSTLNQQAGAVSRLSAASCGLLMIIVLLFLGPVVGKTPVASLAGLLLVLASDLIERDRIAMTMRGTRSDQAAFLATVLGTWIFPLDQAIYLGVGISIVLFLRRARLLTMHEMIIGEKGRFREIDPEAGEAGRACLAIRIMNLTGPLFFAVAGELEAALDSLARNPAARVLILRLRQAQDIDITTVSVLEAMAQKLASQGRTLILLGLRRSTLALLERTEASKHLGQENIFPVQAGWFTAMEAALRRALTLAGEHACGQQCPLAEYLATQEALRSVPETPAPVLSNVKQNH
ncbi:MAG: SulP family inorganic anion transporter [Deltaproteobacteria bacterium]|nr:SulP family inorganic anion transporter [Deltaproteobacteria bacterium]